MKFGNLKKYIAGFMTAAIVCCSSIGMVTSFAAVDWVAMSGSEDITADGAIVMEADTGAVLWGKNIDVQYCPASITKLMTALVVLEKCSLDEEVTVTQEAVSSLESGASAVGLGAGDVLTVRELLYTLLLRSANDSANVLAIHTSGSLEAFAEEMNKKAESLGCKNSIFRNPSGLTSPENLTTAYDMALIGAECSRNETFLEIEKSLSYDISGDARFPDGFTVYQEHKMLLKNTAYTDSRVIAGKTGFITASGNTLVTIAEDNGTRLVAVVLRDRNPQHYIDTRAMLDFGFGNFENCTIDDPLTHFGTADRLLADKIINTVDTEITVAGTPEVTLPKGADISDVTVSYDYNIAAYFPETAIARMIFKYAGVNVGSIYLLNEHESTLVIEDETSAEEHGGQVSINIDAGLVIRIMIAAAAAAIVILIAAVIFIRKRREEEQRKARRERRRRRLADLNISEDDFEELVKKYGRAAEGSMDAAADGLAASYLRKTGSQDTSASSTGSGSALTGTGSRTAGSLRNSNTDETLSVAESARRAKNRALSRRYSKNSVSVENFIDDLDS